MRSGKSVLTACLSAHAISEILAEENLQEKLGLVKGQMIDCAFLAASSEQSSETIYRHFLNFYHQSPWFKNYKKALMDLESSHVDGLKRGDLYKETEKSIEFKNKNILIKSLHSNSATLAGKTRMFAVIDELARFDEGSGGKRTATEVYRVLQNSLLTVRAAVNKLRKKGDFFVPDAAMYCISSPLSSEDRIMRLLETAKNNKRMLALKLPTWVANPEISKEDLSEHYLADPLGAERDFGCNPPFSETPFIENPKLIEACIDRDRQSVFTAKEKYFTEKVQGVEFDYVSLDILDVRHRNLIDYIATCDPGRNKDSFCITLAHEEDDKTIIDGSLECRGIPKGNPQKLVPRSVHFPGMLQILLDLNRILSLKAVCYDRWQSLHDIDILRNHGILAVGENLDRDDHVKFSEALRRGLIRVPNRELGSEALDPRIHRNIPIKKALWELATLNDDGRKVDHSPSGSNDLIVTWVNAHRLLKNPEKVLKKDVLLRKNRMKLPMNRKAFGQVVHLKRFV